MKLKFYLYLIIVFLLILGMFGCKSKQVTTEKEVVKEINTSEIISGIKEIEYRDRLIYLTRPVSGNTIIENPCKDGILADIDTQIVSGNNTSRIYSKNGKLYLEQYIDSTTNVLESRYKAEYKRDSIRLSEKYLRDLEAASVIKVYVYPWDYYAFMIAAILFALLWLRKTFSIF